MKHFISLNTHSNYSAYETVITPKDIVRYTVDNGMNSIALTDIGVVRGFSEFCEIAAKYRTLGFKPIYGVQIKCIIDNKKPADLTALVTSGDGFGSLKKLMSLAHSGNKGSLHWPSVTKQDVEKFRDGLLIGVDLRSADINPFEENPFLENVELYRFADFVGIRTVNQFLTEIQNDLYDPDGYISEFAGIDVFELMNRVRSAVVFLENIGKCPVAMCHANYITYKDEFCINALHNASQKDGGSFRLKTDEEMLKEYSFLGKKKAELVVIENTNKVADEIPLFFDGVQSEIRELTQDEFDGEHDIEHDIEFDDDINIIGYEEAEIIIDDYCSLTDISFDDSVTDKLCERISNVSRKV